MIFSINKFIIFVVILLSFQNLYGKKSSPSLVLGFTNSNDLILRSDDCQELVNQKKALCNWKSQMEPEFDPNIVIDKNSCRSDSKKKYQIRASECMPKKIKEVHLRPNYEHGPNCWGSATHTVGIAPKPRFVSNYEFDYWLNHSPLCRKLEPGEKILTGDIISQYNVIHETEKKIKYRKNVLGLFDRLHPGRFNPEILTKTQGYHQYMHTEVFLTDKLVYGKVSPNAQNNFRFIPMKDFFRRGSDRECIENQNREPVLREYDNEPIYGLWTRSKCAYFTLAFRCENLQSYLSKQKLSSTSQDILAKTEELHKIYESKIFSSVFDKSFKLKLKEKNKLIEFASEQKELALAKLVEVQGQDLDTHLTVLWFFTAQGIIDGVNFTIKEE